MRNAVSLQPVLYVGGIPNNNIINLTGSGLNSYGFQGCLASFIVDGRLLDYQTALSLYGSVKMNTCSGKSSPCHSLSFAVDKRAATVDSSVNASNEGVGKRLCVVQHPLSTLFLSVISAEVHLLLSFRLYLNGIDHFSPCRSEQTLLRLHLCSRRGVHVDGT